MKITRLLETAMLLLGKGEVTAGALAQRFGVSIRTVYRDIDELSTAGVPVYTNRGVGGGIALLPGFTVDRALLSGGERDSLLVALKTLEAARYPEAGPALEKLGAIFKAGRGVEDDDWIDVTSEPQQSDPNENGRFTAIKAAIRARRVIRFYYINSQGEDGVREAEPQRLVYNGSSFYLLAFCRRHNALRTFRLTRMKDVVVTDERFAPHTDTDAGIPAGLPADDRRRVVTIRLRFSPAVLYRVYDYFDEAFITKEQDGSCIAEVNWPEDEWVYGYILSFGSNCEVLEPAQLRAVIATRLRKAAALYKTE